ncbi:MAG: FG-GAP-like repeat-containing protein [Myxococcota bacterium]
MPDASGVPVEVIAQREASCTDPSARDATKFEATELPAEPDKRPWFWGAGVVGGDFDGDGFLDVVLPGAWQTTMFRGGLFGFVDSTDQLPAPFALSSGGSAADFDGDGDLDLLLTRFLAPNVLLRNDDGWFVDVTAEAGLSDEARRSVVSSWGDIDHDGDLDLYVGCYGFIDESGSDPNHDGLLARRARLALPQRRRRHLHRPQRPRAAVGPRRLRPGRRPARRGRRRLARPVRRQRLRGVLPEPAVAQPGRHLRARPQRPRARRGRDRHGLRDRRPQRRRHRRHGDLRLGRQRRADVGGGRARLVRVARAGGAAERQVARAEDRLGGRARRHGRRRRPRRADVLRLPRVRTTRPRSCSPTRCTCSSPTAPSSTRGRHGAPTSPGSGAASWRSTSTTTASSTWSSATSTRPRSC